MAEATTRTEKFKTYRSEIKTDSFYGITKKPLIRKKVEPKKSVEDSENSKEKGFVRNYVARKRIKVLLYILFVIAVVGLLLFLLIYFGEQFLKF